MITLNQTAQDDNKIRIVIAVYLDSTTIKLATRDITLSSNLWDGKIIGYDTIGNIQQNIDISGGGDLSTAGNFTFSFANYSGTFIDDFFPTTSQPYLYGRPVNVGIVWDGATNENQITWLSYGYITDVSYDASYMYIECLEVKQVEAVTLPPYTVQDAFDNGISYFPLAQEESKGVPIPIIYGGAGVFSGFTDTYILNPALLVNKSDLTWVTSCHKLYSESKGTPGGSDYNIYTLISGLNDVTQWWNTDGSTSGVNNVGYSTLTMMASYGAIEGQIYIRLREIAEVTTESNPPDEILNQDFTDYSVLTNNAIYGFRIGGSTDEAEFGSVNGIATMNVTFMVASEDGTSRDLFINFTRPSGTSAVGGSATVSGTTLVSREWGFTISGSEIDGVLPLQYWIKNDNNGAGNDVRVGNAYLYIYNIKFPGVTRNAVIKDIAGLRKLRG